MAVNRGHDVHRMIISLLGLAVLLVILVLVNGFLSYANVRWDTTEDHIYSLSPGTKNILTRLTVPVTVKFFFSAEHRDLPAALKLYGKRVQEFLGEYEHVSHGRVTVDVVDPKPDSEEEEWAQRYGLRSIQGAAGERLYAGLVFLAADQEERIEFLDPAREALLEYDVTRIIHRLQSRERKVLGVLTALPVFGQPRTMAVPGQPLGQKPWFFITELRKSYDVRPIDPAGGRIDGDVDLVMVIHPKKLSRKMRYALDQYVLGGGNALVFVDPVCLSDRPQQGFQPPEGSGLPDLFKAWGVKMDRTQAVADLDQATRVRTRRNTVEENPVWISARAAAFNARAVITAQLERMLFPVAGALVKAADSPYEFEPLVRSGTNAALVNAFVAGFNARTIRSDITPGGERFNLAVRVRGRFKTAFPSGPPEEDTGDGEKAKPEETSGHLSEAREPATLILVADADMLADEFYVRRSHFPGFALSSMFNDNLNFLANAVEILSGSDELIGLRSRGKFERPFTVVMDLRRRAQERWLSKEKELMEKAEATNRKLRELEQGKEASQKLILSPEQEAEIAKFRAQKVQINRELKEVRKNLRKDIEALGRTLKGVNIFLMPLVVSLAGLGFATVRHRRMRRR